MAVALLAAVAHSAGACAPCLGDRGRSQRFAAARLTLCAPSRKRERPSLYCESLAALG